MILTRTLHWSQLFEFVSIHAEVIGVEEVSEEVEELGEVLTECTAIVNAELLQERGGHEHDRVGVETAVEGLVQVVPSQQLFNN